MQNLPTLIKFNGDLNAKFDPNLIDQLLLKNTIDNIYEKCEHWGWNEEGENEHPFFDFGCIGNNLHFESYTDKTEIFTGEYLIIGSQFNNKNIEILRPDQIHNETIIYSARFYFEITFDSRPDSMQEFADMIINAYNSFIKSLKKTKRDYRKKSTDRWPDITATHPDDDDLPF